jgi:Spy/CpxP family protein refolding chaperone
MTHSPKQLIAAAVLATLGLAAVAQPAPAPAPYGAAAPQARPDAAGRHDPAKWQARMAERLARFKQKLQITPAQEGAWAAWTAAIQPPANMKRPDRAEFEKLTTPERIDRMRALRAERMARMDKRGDATKTFYAALSPEQKRVFDESRARGGRGGHHHRHHG